MEKGSSAILRKLRASDMHRSSISTTRRTAACFSRPVWTEGRKWSKYGIKYGEGWVGFSLFFPPATKGSGSGSRDVKKGGNAVIVLPSGLKSSSFARSVTVSNGRLRGKMGMLEASRIGMASVKCEKSVSGLSRGKYLKGIDQYPLSIIVIILNKIQ